MRATSLDVVRPQMWTLRALEPVMPWVLFIVFIGGFAALPAALQTRSPLIIGGGALALVAAAGAFVGWLLLAERRAAKPPRHVPWGRQQWAEFEAAFWSYVERRSNEAE